MKSDEVYSEYEVKESAIRFDKEETSTNVGCVNSLEETLNVKKITKKCEGVTRTVAVKGDGTGEIKLTLHMKYNLFVKAYGMDAGGLIDGIKGYGRDSIHKSFSFVGKVFDENGTCKLKAYPNLLITNGISRKIENGAEEIAEIELTANVNPDENGFGMYEVITDNLKEQNKEQFIENWMTKFSPEMVKKVEVEA